MRQTFKLVLDKLHGFLNGNDDHPQIEDNSLTAMIEQANTMLIANKLSSKIFQKT